MSQVLQAKVPGALQVQARVIGALILRDMRTRFGRSYLGFVIAIGIPLGHLLTLLVSFLVAQRFVPLGTDRNVFPATGILPYMIVLYPARMTMLAIQANKPLLMFPIVTSSDLIIARAILEVLAAFAVFLIFFAMMSIFDPNIIPPDPATAMIAIFATIYFGFSLGYLSAVLYALTQATLFIQIVLLIGLYISSGAFFIPTALPASIQNVLWFNPLLHSVLWLRSAYYENYGANLLSPIYLIGVSTSVLLIGIASERLTRGKILSP